MNLPCKIILSLIHGQVSGGTLVTVPASLVDWLRRAAYAEIGSAAEELDTAAFSTDREAHPEWFPGPMQSLREVYALLEAIGWAKTDPPLGVQIDLSQDGWALMRVLASALEFADEDISETACSIVEHAAAARPAARARRGGRACRRALGLHGIGAGAHRRPRGQGGGGDRPGPRGLSVHCRAQHRTGPAPHDPMGADPVAPSLRH